MLLRTQLIPPEAPEEIIPEKLPPGIREAGKKDIPGILIFKEINLLFFAKNYQLHQDIVPYDNDTHYHQFRNLWAKVSIINQKP